jgi:hypothetical protein
MKKFKDTWVFRALVRIYNAIFAAFIFLVKQCKKAINYLF